MSRPVSITSGAYQGEFSVKSNTARILLECNFRCPFCFAAWHDDKAGPTDGEGRNLPPGKDWFRLIQRMREKGYERLAISGGEPTMHPDIVPLIKRAKQLGFRSIELQTNGSLLTEKNARRLAYAGVTDALVSLHSHHESVFDKITVTEGVFHAVVQGIQHLINLGINVMVSHVIIKYNVADLVDFVRYCHTNLPGIREILFFSMQPEARGAKNMHLWPPLPLVRTHLRPALDECVRLGVGFRMDSQVGFPMCFVGGHEHRVDLVDVTQPHETFGEDLSSFRVIERKKVKLPHCADCFFESACYGFWEDYFTLFGTDGVVPVPHDVRLATLFPHLASPGDAHKPPLLPVRRKGQVTVLPEDVVTNLPLPWKEGRRQILAKD